RIDDTPPAALEDVLGHAIGQLAAFKVWQMPAKSLAEISCGKMIRILAGAGLLLVRLASELIRMINADEDDLAKTHVIRELQRHHRDGVSLPAALGEISEEPRAQAAAGPEKRRVMREVDQRAVMPADELGHRQSFDLVDALLDNQ